MVLNEHDLLAEISRLKGENEDYSVAIKKNRLDYAELLSKYGCMASEYACYVERVEAMKRAAITVLRCSLKDD